MTDGRLVVDKRLALVVEKCTDLEEERGKKRGERRRRRRRRRRTRVWWEEKKCQYRTK